MGRFFFNAHFDPFHNFCVTFFKLLSLSKLGNAPSQVSFARNTVLGPRLTGHGATLRELNFLGIVGSSRFTQKGPD